MSRVVKLGGSLLDGGGWQRCLSKMVADAHPLVVVPGGGLFADQVRNAQRRWGIDNAAAHRMAIHAMQQMAELMRSLQPSLTLVNSNAKVAECLVEGKNVIWSPLPDDLDNAGISASWEVTSDSLAAWLAIRLNASQLIVIKAATIPPDSDINTLSQTGILDAAFPEFCAGASFPISVFNQDQFLIDHDAISKSPVCQAST